MKKVSIVIGLYNSEKTIQDVLDEITFVFSKQTEYLYEIILVDDYSPDGVYEFVKKIAKEDTRIKVLHLSKNVGQTNAVMEGYRYAQGDYIVEMDDDMQMPASAIPDMLHMLEAGNYDVVFAKYPEQKESAFRRFGSRINNKMTEIMLGKPRDIRINSFFAMRKFVAQEIIKYANNYPYLYGIIFAVTTNVANLNVVHRERTVKLHISKIVWVVVEWFSKFFGSTVAVCSTFWGNNYYSKLFNCAYTDNSKITWGDISNRMDIHYSSNYFLFWYSINWNRIVR